MPRRDEALEAHFAEAFGFRSDIVVRSAADIAALVKAAPFKKVKAAEGVRTLRAD